MRDFFDAKKAAIAALSLLDNLYHRVLLYSLLVSILLHQDAYLIPFFHLGLVLIEVTQEYKSYQIE